ncbi:MAG: hypothetical protein ACXVJO_12430 [Thermoanaerobaculia bacterium]
MMSGIAFLAMVLVAAEQHASDILGRWEGTSICVKTESNRACHDEEVRYTCTPSPDDAKLIRMKAEKKVNGVYEWMGDLDLTYDAASRKWNSEFHMQSGQRAVWSFAIDGKVMTGTCTLYPGKIVGRNVQARRLE